MEHLTKNPPASIAGEKVVRVGRSDGLKLYLDEFTFVLIRPSGTEPILRVSYEAPDADRIDKVMADFKNQAEIILKNLTAPAKTGAASH